jgi:hypothetical protein
MQIEHTTFEFSDPKLERLVGLTPADRKWMDDVVKTVEDSWNPVSLLLRLGGASQLTIRLTHLGHLAWRTSNTFL